MCRPWPLEHPTPKVVSPARTCPPRVIYPLHLVPIIYRYRASHLTPREGGLATGGEEGAGAPPPAEGYKAHPEHPIYAGLEGAEGSR